MNPVFIILKKWCLTFLVHLIFTLTVQSRWWVKLLTTGCQLRQLHQIILSIHCSPLTFKQPASFKTAQDEHTASLDWIYIKYFSTLEYDDDHLKGNHCPIVWVAGWISHFFPPTEHFYLKELLDCIVLLNCRYTLSFREQWQQKELKLFNQMQFFSPIFSSCGWLYC